MGAGRALSRRSLLRGATAAGATAALGRFAGCSSDPAPRADPPAARTPNVIVVLADDMRHDEVEHMPNLTSSLVERGVTFTGARHNISLCSPARAGFLTGQLSMRHRVRSQQDSFGRLNDDRNTLPAWLEAAGYDTAIIGKYFTPAAAERRLPGWRLQRVLAEDSQEQYGFSVSDGERVTRPRADQTAYLRDEVLEFLETATEPYFLWFTPTANHWPLQAPPGHEADAASVEWPDAREDDVADKPPWIRSLPPFGADQLATVRHTQRLRIRELLGLDDTIADVVEALERRDQIDHTVILFASDNGVFQGEHRLPLLSKNLPYDPSVRAPCVLRAPGLPRGRVDQPAHMLVDLTATCVAAAGAEPGLRLDGVSLLDIVEEPSAYDDRVLVYDRDDRDDPPGLECPPAVGVFTFARKLVRYDTEPPVVELYDLERDPDELDNAADDPAYADDRRQLEDDLDALLRS